MTTAKLSTSEIGQVLEAEKRLFTDAVKDSAGTTSDGSKGSDVLASLDKIGDHVTGTVDEEMDKSSNGDETVIALLGRGSDERSSVAEAAKEETDTTKKNDEIKTANGNVEEERGNEGENGTGASTNAAASTGAATPQEIKAAKAAIAFTDPGSGVVALSDGTLFDPKYYAGANPDVVSQYGTSTEALLAEWLKEGKAQGRPPIAPVQTVAKANTEEKPDWLIRQEQKEREQAQANRNEDEDNDSGDDSSSNSGSGSGGGQGGNPGGLPSGWANGTGTAGVQNLNGDEFSINNNTYHYESSGSNANTIWSNTAPANSLALPVTLDNNGSTFNVDMAQGYGLVDWDNSAIGAKAVGEVKPFAGNPGKRYSVEKVNSGFKIRKFTGNITQPDEYVTTYAEMQNSVDSFLGP